MMLKPFRAAARPTAQAGLPACTATHSASASSFSSRQSRAGNIIVDRITDDLADAINNRDWAVAFPSSCSSTSSSKVHARRLFLQPCSAVSNSAHIAVTEAFKVAEAAFDGSALLTGAAVPYVGPIAVQQTAGKGRGVIATEAIAPGQLLLCCLPLGVVTGLQQARLPVEALQKHLASSWSQNTGACVNQLYDGNSTPASVPNLAELHILSGRHNANTEAQLYQVIPSSTPGSSPGHTHDRPQNSRQHQYQCNRQQQQHQDSHQQLQGEDTLPQSLHGPAATHGSSNGSSSQSGSMQQSPRITDHQLQQLIDVVHYNAYGDLHDDLAAAAVAGVPPVSLLGLWPAFSLLNHSCVPNASNWVLPGASRAMVVRAARHIAAGEEVTISYLGGPQLLPLQQRREALLQNFGFTCCCPRCMAEEDVPDGIAELLQDIVSRVNQSFVPCLECSLHTEATQHSASSAADYNNNSSAAEPVARASASAATATAPSGVAVQVRDIKAVKEVRRQAATMMTLLYTQLRQHKVHPQVRWQLLASCYCCLELLADADAALGDTAAAADSLGKCLSAAAAVTPGSDLHVIVASKLEALQRQVHGQEIKVAQQAWSACVTAHTARYGVLREELVQQLAVLNWKLYI